MEALVLADSLAHWLEALIDADVLADSLALVGSTQTRTYLLIQMHLLRALCDADGTC